MDKIANEIYLKKTLYNHLDHMRPMVRDIITMIKPYMFVERYVKFLRAQIAEELPEENVTNTYIRKSLMRIRPSYRKVATDIIAKAYEFMPPDKFLSFSKEFYNSNFTYL